MAAERLVFDPDGDLCLRLQYIEEGKNKEGNEATSPSLESADANLPMSPLGSLRLAPIRVDQHADDDEEITKEVEMLVSSKHLMLASPVFNAMFKHDFLEGDTLRSNGKAEVPLPDDDTKAMEIALNIIHGRVRRVPREVTLDTMTALSVLVDKYQMHEVVELYVEIWMRHLKPLVPKFFSGEFYKWLSISWVFRLEVEFKHLTWIATRESAGINPLLQPHPDPSLPIPEVVLGKNGKYRLESPANNIHSGNPRSKTKGYLRYFIYHNDVEGQIDRSKSGHIMGTKCRNCPCLYVDIQQYRY